MSNVFEHFMMVMNIGLTMRFFFNVEVRAVVLACLIHYFIVWFLS